MPLLRIGGERTVFWDTLDYTAALGGDWSRVSPPRVRPGDTIVVHASICKDDRTNYSHAIMSDFTTCCGTTWDGTYHLTSPTMS